VNYGSANGELARGVIIEADNPNLIRIPYAIGQVKLVAIQRSGAKAINQLDDLKPLRIGVLRGFVTTEKLSKSLKREIYNDLPGLFKGLNKKRVDVILFTQLDSQYYFRQLQQKNKTQQALIFSQPLMEIPVYHYLHKRSKNIANALQQEMQKMQASGELQQLINNAEQKFMAIKPNALKTH
jgi:polar amino acid transport system substrate-binding protein